MNALSGVATWEQILPIITACIIVAGAVWALFNWVYRDSNNTRAEIQRVAAGANEKIDRAANEHREAIARLREDISERYVSVETHSIVAKTIEKAIDELKGENRRAIDHMADRVDSSIVELTKAVAMMARQ